MSLPLWGMVCSVPYNVICIWAILRMVPIRRKWLFSLLWQVACLPIFLIPGESAYGWMRTVASSVLWLTLVLLFSEKRSLRVVFAAVLISLLSVVTEAVTTMLTILLFGRYVSNALVLYEPRIMLMVQILFWNIFALLCWVLVRLWKRSVRSQAEPHLRLFVLVPLSQHFPLIFAAVFSLLTHAPLRDYLLLGTMALCCVVADFLLLRGLRSYTAQQLARQQAELLEKQLQQQLDYYNSVVAHIEETARLRHDLRNQLQTVYTLMDRGEHDRAREVLTAFAAPLAAGEEEV